MKMRSVRLLLLALFATATISASQMPAYAAGDDSPGSVPSPTARMPVRPE